MSCTNTNETTTTTDTTTPHTNPSCDLTLPGAKRYAQHIVMRNGKRPDSAFVTKPARRKAYNNNTNKTNVLGRPRHLHAGPAPTAKLFSIADAGLSARQERQMSVARPATTTTTTTTTNITTPTTTTTTTPTAHPTGVVKSRQQAKSNLKPKRTAGDRAHSAVRRHVVSRERMTAGAVASREEVERRKAEKEERRRREQQQEAKKAEEEKKRQKEEEEMRRREKEMEEAAAMAAAADRDLFTKENPFKKFFS